MGVIAKQSIRGTIVTYLGVFVGFLTTFFVLTRFLSAEEIGLARVLVDAATLFIALAQLGTNSSIIRFYPHFAEKNTAADPKSVNEHGFFFWTILIPLVGFVVFALIFFALHTPLARYFGEKSVLFVNYYYFVLPLAFFMLYQTIFETNAIVRMRIVFPRTVRELFTRIGLLGVYLLYAFRLISMDGFVIAICVVYALAMLCNIVYLFSFGNISLRPDIAFLKQHPEVVRSYLTYTAFLILSSLATVLAPYLSSFIISAQQGLSQTGIFAIATYIAVIVSIPSRSVVAIASLQLSDAIKNNDTPQISMLTKQVAQNLFLVGALLLLAIYINIDLIFRILPNGETYSVAKQCVLLLGITQLLIATFSISTNTLNYSRHYYFSLLWSALLTIGALLLNNLLIPRYGLNGAAIAGLIAYLAYYLLILLTVGLSTRTTPFSLSMLKALSLMLVLTGINALWTSHFTIGTLWLDSVLRSVLLLGTGCIVAYKWNISPDINREVQKRFHRK